MRALDIILKKRDGNPLTREEISFIIAGYTQGDIPDYQMSAFLMACYFSPLNFDETFWLTEAMLHSGKIVDLSGIATQKIDKHSTGGVGDKTSLVLSPIVACCGISVPMVSGRGLGHTGGTLDKLESIPGFRINLSLKEFKSLLKSSYMAMMGQTPEIAPADRKIYALRDATGTVESIPLITSSIMSKKLAEGADGLVLDVKFGLGAFMTDFKEAKRLAEWLVKIGEAFGKKMVAVLSDMNQPLGNTVGNSLEVEESISVLKGEGPNDLAELCLVLSGHMIGLGGKAASFEEGIKLAQEKINSGEAYEKFQLLVKNQGGDLKKLPKAKKKKDFLSSQTGIISQIDAKVIGLAASKLGCGRAKMSDKVDPSAGFKLHKKVGDRVREGETLLTLYYNDEKKRALAEQTLKCAYGFSQSAKLHTPLIRETIGA